VRPLAQRQGCGLSRFSGSRKRASRERFDVRVMA
jgi:hypothetical protein